MTPAEQRPPDQERYIEVEGDKHKVEPTRHYFSAIVAGLKTAQEYLLDVQRELEQSLGRERALREALRQIAEGEPEPTDADVSEGIYPMLNRTHEVHLYQRIAERALATNPSEEEAK